MLVERFHTLVFSRVFAMVAVLSILAAAFISVDFAHSGQRSQAAEVGQSRSIHMQFVQALDDMPCHPHSNPDCQTVGSTTCPHSCGLVFSMDTVKPFDNGMATSALRSRPPDPAPGGNLFRPPIVLS